MNWFGRKKKAEASSSTSASSKSVPSDPTAAIVTLRQSIATQEKREEHLHRKIDGMVKEAKERMAKKDKKGALFCMKKKKLYEQELEKIENVKMTLETQVMNLESATQNVDTYKAMEAGTKTMKKIRTDVGIEKVDEMMDDIREEMEMANEISSAIAQSVDPILADEDELLAELNALEEEDLEAELLKPTPSKKATASGLNMPAVPNKKLPALTTKEEEEELKNLEAEIAGM